MTTLTHPKHRACQLVNDYARLKAALDTATAPIRAEITALTAALSTAAKPYEAQLEAIEQEAKQLALDHGEALFGDDKRSLTENGFTLALREAEAVQCEDEAAAIHMLEKDAAATLPGSDTAMACNACLRVTKALDKEYILRRFHEAPAWFAQYGIEVVEKQSASLKPAPKPRATKATQAKKLKAADMPVESEAA